MSATTPALIPNSSAKIHYIDHLKVLLTVLVILHHSAITYGAPGGWYYTQRTTQMGALIPMTMFVAINQAFFMGFFFFLSTYFIGPSFEKKGAARFATDRLLRLGLPLAFYSLILSPVLTYLVYYFGYGHHITFLQYLGGFDDWIDFGVLWFVAALLLFTLLYVVWKTIFKNALSLKIETVYAGKIVLFALLIGILSFLVRTVFPVGWVLKPVGFQLGHFSQYIGLFVLGLAARKNNLLDQISAKTAKRMLLTVILLVLFFPVFYIIKTIFNIPLDWYNGGWHWPSLLYAVWEQLIGFSIITVLLYYGKKFWNRGSIFLSKLSRLTFAVYIFHPLLVISLSLAIRNWQIDPALKLLFVGPLAVAGSFLLASTTVKIPGVKRVI